MRGERERERQGWRKRVLRCVDRPKGIVDKNVFNNDSTGVHFGLGPAARDIYAVCDVCDMMMCVIAVARMGIYISTFLFDHLGPCSEHVLSPYVDVDFRLGK